VGVEDDALAGRPEQAVGALGSDALASQIPGSDEGSGLTGDFGGVERPVGRLVAGVSVASEDEQSALVGRLGFLAECSGDLAEIHVRGLVGGR
jgi:hypothetical protein